MGGGNLATNKKEYGFTLIELLAVIVILAVIALIATPIIIGVINDAKKGSYRDSLYSIVKSAEIYQMKLIETKDDSKLFVEFPTDMLEVKGNEITEGYLTVHNNGKTSFILGNGTYCGMKEFASEDIKVLDGTCDEQTPKKCFEMDESGSQINDYLCDGKHDGYDKIADIIIPKQIIPGINVTKIGGPSKYVGAFQQKELTSVYLPLTLVQLGDSSFRINQLKQIIIPNQVKNIIEDSFYVNKLENIFISNSVRRIDGYSFNVNQLPDKQATIYARNADGTENKKVVASYGGSNTGTLLIQDGVEELGSWSIAAGQYTNIVLPESLKKIGIYSIYTSKITNLTIPKNVEEIGEYAFYKGYLKTIVFKGIITPQIGINAFGLCNNLEIIYVPKGTKMAYYQLLKNHIYNTDKYITEDMIVEQ